MTISLPEGIEVISEGCFYNSGVKEVHVPASVKRIEGGVYDSKSGSYINGAFQSCKSLQTITFAPNSQLKEIGQHAFQECGSLTISLPEGIEVISEGCFYSSGVKEVHIPASVKRIEGRVYDSHSGNYTSYGAFQSCYSLQKVTFAPGSQLTSIG